MLAKQEKSFRLNMQIRKHEKRLFYLTTTFPPSQCLIREKGEKGSWASPVTRLTSQRFRPLWQRLIVEEIPDNSQSFPSDNFMFNCTWSAVPPCFVCAFNSHNFIAFHELFATSTLS